MTDRPDQPEEHSDDTAHPEDASTFQKSAAMIGGQHAGDMIGVSVGQYTIKRVIGSGGMGTVFEAMQQSPRRTVALKMMKQGLTSRSAVRRFEYEAQTLGRLRHQHIGQIYEAGTLDDGINSRPFFAMEYVVGAKSLTQYARDKKLGTRERLELFSKVCDAVQHGHQKGIIHRDLKPGNILVTSNGVPKIIDFGVARSTDSDMAVTTLQTDVGALIGTLQYMSPEQCVADPNDIDTRSDVYTLGVILYELLCESLPYDVSRVSIYEAARIVQQEEPAKLSIIDKRLRGDIETITLKAMEKDRDRRYQSATDLEQDIQHYLSDEPISARPPGAIDYLSRFARKHRASALAIGAVFVVMVAALIAISIFALNAEREKKQAEQVKEFVSDMLSSVDPTKSNKGGKEPLNQLLSDASVAVGSQFTDQPLVEAEIREVIGNTYLGLGKSSQAEPHFVEAMATRRLELGDEHPDTLSSINSMANLLIAQGRFDEAEQYCKEALEGRRRALGNEHPDTLTSVLNYGYVLERQGRYNEAEEYYTESLDTRRRVMGDRDPSTLLSRNAMGLLLHDQGRYDEAEEQYREALKGYRIVLGDLHPQTLWSINNLGGLLIDLGRYDEAENYILESMEGYRRVLGSEHPHTLESISYMSSLLISQGTYNEATPYLTECLETRRRVLGDQHPATLSSINRMGSLLQKLGKPDEAEQHYREALAGRRRILGNEHPETLSSIHSLSMHLIYYNKFEEAEPYSQEALKSRRKVLGEEHPDTLAAIMSMGSLLNAQGNYEQAEEYYRKALESRRRIFGDEHPETLLSVNSMGNLFYAQGKYNEAEPYFREDLEVSRRILGDDHPETLVSIGSFGSLLYKQEKYDEAEPYFREELESSRRILGDEHPYTLISIRSMGTLLYRQEKYEDAKPYYLEALESSRRILGDANPETVRTIRVLIRYYDTWHEVDPGSGHDAKAAEYRSMLEIAEVEPPAVP